MPSKPSTTPHAGCRPNQLLVEGDHLAWRFHFAGTHLGEFQGIPASGRPFDIPGITVLRFGERRCVERWSAADFLTMMIQIGPSRPRPETAQARVATTSRYSAGIAIAPIWIIIVR